MNAEKITPFDYIWCLAKMIWSNRRMVQKWLTFQCLDSQFCQRSFNPSIAIVPFISLSIDLRSLVLFTVLSFFVNGVFLVLIFGIRQQVFLKWLAYGCFSFAIGWVLFFMRFKFGINLITLPLANILILLMPISMVFSILNFLNQRYSKWYIFSILFFLSFTFLLLAWYMKDPLIPGVYSSIANGFFYLTVGIVLMRKMQPKPAIAWVIISLNGLNAFFLFLRAGILGMTWLFPLMVDPDLRLELLTDCLYFNIIFMNAQVLCFPILDFINAQHDLEVANRQLEELSNRDVLTGFLNRRTLNQRIQVEIDRFQRAGIPFSVILFDVDHFKQINDNFGHLVGDLVLEQLAQLVQQLLRSGDLVTRYGGEEFLVLLPMTNLAKALDVAERLRLSLSLLQFNHPDIPTSYRVTASFGVATFGAGMTTADALLKQADVALYQAKTQGRNRVCPM